MVSLLTLSDLLPCKNLVGIIIKNKLIVCNSFYVPVSPFYTSGLLRGKQGWFTERQKQIAITRIIRDDLSKVDQEAKITWHDIKISVLDTKLWTHLIITFAR